MKINIVLPLKDNWIFEDIAKKLKKNLKKKNLKVRISRYPLGNFDVYHHISYLNCNIKTLNKDKVNTAMITHIDTTSKLNLVKKLNNYIDCFTVQSLETKKYVSKFLEKIKTKVIYVPPNDNISFNKVKLGIFSNKYPDGRKNEKILIKTLRKLNKDVFEIFIMGQNWEKEIKQFKKLKFDFRYINKFNIGVYKKILKQIDYLLYLGFDEGSISFMDGLKSGTKLIVTNQGFHKDFSKFIDYRIDDINNDLFKHLIKIEKDVILKNKFIDSINYKNFTEQHLKLWSKIIINKKIFNKKTKNSLNDFNLIKDTVNRKFNILKYRILNEF